MSVEPRRASVVVVDDNATDVILIKEAILAQKLDVDLRIYEDGEAAMGLIERVEQEEEPCPHLILLDLNLPRRDGLEVLARLRGVRRCAGIPVVVMTSSAASSDRVSSDALGVAAYFQKPSEYAAFLEIGNIIRAWLR
jgi:CheY-like chemotaxis protein